MKHSHLGVALAAASMLVATAAVPTLDPDRDDVVEIEMTASRFRFTPDTVSVPGDARVRLIVHSADVVHGIEIRRLGVTRRIPGRGEGPAVIEFTAPRTGRFEIACSEYCGSGHSRMTAALVVEAGADDGDTQ